MWLEIATFGLAVLGAVLGVLNTWSAMNQNRIRLRVSPAYAVHTIAGPGTSLQVVNLSGFPVTISEAGFSLSGKQRLALIDPVVIDSGPFPRRLESRESVTLFVRFADLPPAIASIRGAYATTACGVTRHGDSPALREIVEEARKALASRTAT